MKKNSHPQRPTTRQCCIRLQRQVVVLFASVLVMSIIKIAYEFTQTARSAIDQPRRAHGSSPPASDTRRLSAHSPLPPPATSGDLGSDLLARSASLWPVSRGLSNSHVVRADMKINSSHTLHFRGGYHSYAPTSLPSFKARAALSPQSWERPVKSVRTTQPLVVIIVCSKPENTELRLAIRRTWGLEVRKSQIALRFFMGRDETWDSILRREQTLHGDVVRTEHPDTYENLSYKVLQGLSWVLGNVKRATHIMKIDDDTYVSLPLLMQELRDNAAMQDPARKSVLGAVCVNSHVVRDDGDKWFVSALTYPSDVYPNYVFGGGYVLTRSAAEAIVAASRKTDYLHLEDVFITGILAKAAAVTLVSHAGFSFWTSKRPTPCDIVKGRRVTAASLTSKQFYVLYSGIHSLLRAGNWTRC